MFVDVIRLVRVFPISFYNLSRLAFAVFHSVAPCVFSSPFRGGLDTHSAREGRDNIYSFARKSDCRLT